jgi:gliding motility-associated-like protein
MKQLLISFLMVSALGVAAQPFINSIDKTHGTANELVTITGGGFSSPKVYFGIARSSSVTVVSANILIAAVPPHATTGPIIVENGDGRSAASSQVFYLSFHGGNSVTLGAIGTQTTSQNGTYDLCLCDFNLDGLLDAAITNNSTSNSSNIVIAGNTSTPGANSFLMTNLSSDRDNTYSISCADLNGDGYADLVATTRVPPTLHIFENPANGTMNFQRRLLHTLPNLPDGTIRAAGQVKLADIDGDGKIDVVVGNDLVGDNTILVYRNNSAGNVSVNTTPAVVTVPGASHAGSIALADLDNDGKSDIVTVPFSLAANRVNLLRNTSVSGSVSFESKGFIGASSERYNIVVGDFNQDGRNDIAVTRRDGSSANQVEIYRNNGNFGFTLAQNINMAAVNTWGIDAGDVNGDGWLDLLVGSVQSSTGSRLLYFQNTQSGSISMGSAQQFPAAGTSFMRNVRIADMNDDGKPDFVFTHNTSGSLVGNLGWIMNRSCIIPEIVPEQGTFCDGIEFLLKATESHNHTYNWAVNSNPEGGNFSTLDISNTGGTASVTLRLDSPDGQCDESIGPFVFNRSAATGSGKPVLTTPNPTTICAGDNLVLTTSSTGMANYYWFGPNGFSETTGASQNTITITNAQPFHSGAYTVIVNDGDCSSPESDPRNVLVSQPAITSIGVTNCNDGTLTFTVPDNSADYNYQWKRGGTDILSATNPTYVSNIAGNYSLVIEEKTGQNCTFETPVLTIFNSPTSSFTGPTGGSGSQICVDTPTSFSATSAVGSGATGQTLSYTWEVTSPSAVTQTFTGQNLNYTFNATGSWTVRLITGYNESPGCKWSTQAITVVPEPSFALNSPADKCPADEVTLQLVGESGVESYQWSTGDISQTLNVVEPGDYTLTYTTFTGCVVTTSPTTVSNLAGSGIPVDVSAPATIQSVDVTSYQVILGSGQPSVTITASNSGNHVWSIAPGSTGSFSTTNAATTTYTPSKPVETIILNADDNAGCFTEITLEIISSTGAMKAFSPNGDARNDLWGIQNGLDYTGCVLTIVDSKGSLVLQVKLEGENYPGNEKNLELWDGNVKGRPVPEGIYYFILKCPDSSNNLSGSILLAR